MSLLSDRNLIRRVDPWMPIKLRSLMTGPEIGVHVGMSLYLQAADVHRTLGNGGSDISGANPCQEPKITLSYWATHLPSQRTIGFYPCSQATATRFHQRSFFSLIRGISSPSYRILKLLHRMHTLADGRTSPSVPPWKPFQHRRMDLLQREYSPSNQRSPASRDLSHNCLVHSAETESRFLIHLKSLWWAGSYWSS
jgi:hypothetical protein